MSARQPPALVRRVLLTVLLAIVVVFIVIFCVIAWGVLKRESGDIDQSTLRSAQVLALALDGVASDEAARGAMTMFADMVLREAAMLPGGIEPPQLLAARLDGGLRLPQAGAIDVLALRDGIAQAEQPQRSLRIYAASSQRWRVAVVDGNFDARVRWVLADTAHELLGYLALTLPIVLLPVWLAVRTALAPLQQLSDAVAARAPGDMSPLLLPRTYRELLPLQLALNRLFERVAGNFAREKAFVHDAAHELRTPLAVIGTQAHVLVHAEGADRAGAGRRLQGAVERASHLAHQLLRLAQADALALAPRVPVDVMNLARDTLAGFAEAAGAQGSELSLSGPDSAVLNTDPRALRSMLENGVDNALRYGSAGVAVDVTLHVSGAQWQLRVADNGPGIAPEHREQAFERFWRGKAEQARGAGLGLAIVREAARSLGGDAHLEDGPAGRGCMLVVQLPL